MYLYSLPGLHTKIQQTEYYQGKRPSIKPVLIDKVNWLIHSIIEGNKQHWNLFNYKEVPLNRGILKNMMGKTEYLTIIRMLERMNIIDINHKYTSTTFINQYNADRKRNNRSELQLKPESKKYALSDYALTLGVKKVGILSPRMQKKISQYKQEKIKQYSKQETHSKILHSITKLQFIPNHPKALKALEMAKNEGGHKADHYNEVYNEMQEFNQCDNLADYAKHSAFYYTQSERVNRVFHYYSTIPKPFRESLQLKDGNPLSEIDLRNSQPLIIGLNYINSIDELSPSDTRLFKDLVGGNFYQALANQARHNDDQELYNLYTDNYSKFKAKVLGEGLYFNYIPDLHKIKPMERYMMQLYPNFINYIRTKKRKLGYKIISIEAQQIESDIFIDKLYNKLNNSATAIPVHDSIIIPSSDKDFYLNILIDIFKDKFPYFEKDHIRPLFRITDL